MKNKLLLFVLSITFFGCSVSEKPEFIKVNSVKIINTSLQNLTVQANLQFENKNIVGGTLQAKDIHIFIEGKDVAVLNTKKFKVPKKSEFELPLQVVIPFNKIYNDGNKDDLLNNLINAFVSKKVAVSYKGKIEYKLGAINYDYQVDYTQEVKLKY